MPDVKLTPAQRRKLQQVADGSLHWTYVSALDVAGKELRDSGFISCPYGRRPVLTDLGCAVIANG